jgi:hypothetical protein
MLHSLRQSVRARYNFRCGYCGVLERHVGSELTIDHFQPVSQGGTDDIENLVYCCHACNSHKSDFWTTDPVYRLLHPLNDDPTLHYHEDSEGFLLGLTGTGTFHIERLHLNRPPLIEHRLCLRWEQESVVELQEPLEHYQEAMERIAQMERFFGMPPTLPDNEVS